MTIKHSNPTRPRTYSTHGVVHQVRAHSPYNFVSLPDNVVQAQPPLDLNTFKDGLSGTIHCKLTTKSPTYIRGMLELLDYKTLKEKTPAELTDADKQKMSPFFHKTVRLSPCIPGSSLRGMLRSLVEVISYSRVRWVADDQAFFYRTLALPNDQRLNKNLDPRSTNYRDIMKNVRGGVIHWRDNQWQIQPSPLPDPDVFYDNIPFFQVENELAKKMSSKLDNFRNTRFNSPSLSPLPYPEIGLSAEKDEIIEYRNRTRIVIQKNRVKMISEATVKPTTVYEETGEGIIQHDDHAPLSLIGYLMPSGNMMENRDYGESRRHYHAVILKPDPTNINGWKPIEPQAIKDYLDNLTDFQKQRLGPNGVLVKGRPVFYVDDPNNPEIIYFGHSPHFRIPVRTDGWENHSADKRKRASKVSDFIPVSALGFPVPDLTDVIFGWTEEKSNNTRVPLLGPPGQSKGRISVSDARCISTENLYVEPTPQTPKILGGPRPSAFQNYLTQDRQKGHNPDSKSSLAHYGTSPEETTIRGTKRYHHQGNRPEFSTRGEGSQYTKIRALNSNVEFEFEIHFSQLRDEELGALLWALSLPAGDGNEYYHKIGMGKPYGMGSVRIDHSLTLINRQDRYTKLFTDDMSAWHTGTEVVAKTPTLEGGGESALHTEQTYLGAFEKFILGRINPGASRLVQLKRIQELLAMHRWPGPPASETQYQPLAEFKHIPVLPDPICVSTRAGDKDNDCPDTADPATAGAPPRRLQLYDQFADVPVIGIEPEGDHPGYYLQLPNYPESRIFLPFQKHQPRLELNQKLNIQLKKQELITDGSTFFECELLS